MDKRRLIKNKQGFRTQLYIFHTIGQQGQNETHITEAKMVEIIPLTAYRI